MYKIVSHECIFIVVEWIRWVSDDYRKDPKFSDTRNASCNSPKIQTKRPYLKEFCQKHANGIASSENPDQTAPLGAV